MKRFLLALGLAALATTAADAGPLRNLVCRVRNHHGPVVDAVRHNLAAQPVRTVAGRVIELPAKVVESRPVANRFGGRTCVNGNCK